jgi:hypothetical protein
MVPHVDRRALERIPPVADSFLSGLDQVLPGRIVGFVVTGSAVLGDWRPGRSDLDFIALTETPLVEEEIAALAAFHRSFKRTSPRPELDGLYATRAQLSADPRGLVVPRVRDGMFLAHDGYAANPVAWCTVARNPWLLRGQLPRGVWNDAAILRDWCRSNLEGYWSRWVKRARTSLTDAVYSLGREAASWGVLGVARIHATLSTGEIISKSAAAGYALCRFGPAWANVIHEAIAYREGSSSRHPRGSGLRPFRRRALALDFMDMAIADALAIPSAT